MFRVFPCNMGTPVAHVGTQREQDGRKSVLPSRLWLGRIQCARAGLMGAVVLCSLAQLSGAEDLPPKARTTILEWLHRAGS